MTKDVAGYEITLGEREEIAIRDSEVYTPCVPRNSFGNVLLLTESGGCC